MSSNSLEQVEGNWDLPAAATPLMQKVHAYRKLPISTLSTEQMRLLIGQHIGLKYLLPPALANLLIAPFMSGDLYPGDLLASVLRLPDNLLVSSYRKSLVSLLARVNEDIEKIEANKGSVPHQDLDKPDLETMTEIKSRITEISAKL